MILIIIENDQPRKLAQALTVELKRLFSWVLDPKNTLRQSVL